MKNLTALALFLFPLIARSHGLPPWEYICSVSRMNASGEFKNVVNVVYLPEWQKSSHLYHSDALDVFFELKPVLDFEGKEVDLEMTLSLKRPESQIPIHLSTGPKFSEISFENYELNIAARCFHRSMRGQGLGSLHARHQ